MQILTKVAIARFVMREKEYLCIIASYEHGLLLSTLNYAYEVRPMSRIEQLAVTVSPNVTKKEEELVITLIKKMTKKKFDISKYHDSFAEKLTEQIKKSTAGRKLLKERAKKAIKTKELTLLQSLQESLEASEIKRSTIRK